MAGSAPGAKTEIPPAALGEDHGKAAHGGPWVCRGPYMMQDHDEAAQTAPKAGGCLKEAVTLLEAHAGAYSC